MLNHVARRTEDASFEEEEGIWVAHVDFSPEQSHREHGILRWPTMKKYKK